MPLEPNNLGFSVEEELEIALRESLRASLKEEVKTEIESLSFEQKQEALRKLVERKTERTAAEIPEQEEPEAEEPEPQPEVKSLAQKIMDKIRGKKEHASKEI